VETEPSPCGLAFFLVELMDTPGCDRHFRIWCQSSTMTQCSMNIFFTMMVPGHETWVMPAASHRTDIGNKDLLSIRKSAYIIGQRELFVGLKQTAMSQEQRGVVTITVFMAVIFLVIRSILLKFGEENQNRKSSSEPTKINTVGATKTMPCAFFRRRT